MNILMINKDTLETKVIEHSKVGIFMLGRPTDFWIAHIPDYGNVSFKGRCVDTDVQSHMDNNVDVYWDIRSNAQ